MKYEDLTGIKFGKLTPFERISGFKKTKPKWKCNCDCGNQTTVEVNKLKSGHTKSCGCLKISGKHKSSYTRLYGIWRDMKYRCSNHNHRHWHCYGGKGVSICKEWISSFENFKQWSLSNGYSEELTIDRIDYDGNYEPSNCRWATKKEQANNRSTNVVIEFNGKKRTQRQWANITGIHEKTIESRLKKGWSVERILTTQSDVKGVI